MHILIEIEYKFPNRNLGTLVQGRLKVWTETEFYGTTGISSSIIIQCFHLFIVLLSQQISIEHLHVYQIIQGAHHQMEVPGTNRLVSSTLVCTLFPVHWRVYRQVGEYGRGQPTHLWRRETGKSPGRGGAQHEEFNEGWRTGIVGSKGMMGRDDVSDKEII